MASATRSLVHKFRMRELRKALPPIASTSSRPAAIPNPFIPQLNQETGRWAPPRYSLRRQAELIKCARLEGTLHLLPPGPKLKLSEILAAKAAVHNVEEVGDTPGVATPMQWVGDVKRREVPGAGVGNRLYAGKKQMFKGHKWERVRKQRLESRRVVMKQMKKRIVNWRLHHVKRRPWPLSEPRVGKSQKLPF